MATIEERAKFCAEEFARDNAHIRVTPLKIAIEYELTEQDRIARAEERERCINEAIKIAIDMRLILCSDGFTADEFRKRMKKGGEG